MIKLVDEYSRKSFEVELNERITKTTTIIKQTVSTAKVMTLVLLKLIDKETKQLCISTLHHLNITLNVTNYSLQICKLPDKKYFSLLTFICKVDQLIKVFVVLSRVLK